MNQHTLTGRQRLIAALNLQPVDRPPVWFMRQAGRHLPEYRRLRQTHSFLEICRNEELNVIASAEPWHRYGVDGAIVFNDILTPLADMGMSLDFAPGPRFERLIASERDIAALRPPEYGPATDVSRCINSLRDQVGERAAVLGFVGAPFTVAAFAIAGAGAQRRAPLSELVNSDPALFENMQHLLRPILVDYARTQVEAGADVIQIFESLADELTLDDYRARALPHFMQMIDEVALACPGVPVIAFGRGLWPLLGELATTRAAALSLDHTDMLTKARTELRSLGSTKALQGNLSPQVLREEPLVASAAAGTLLSHWRNIVPFPNLADTLGPTGWVFNLGHGMPADANPAAVEGVLAVLHAFEFCPSPQSQGVPS